ncbi:MAG: hypothetical protein RIT26_1060 [Pseudomonadota bacterium]
MSLELQWVLVSLVFLLASVALWRHLALRWLLSRSKAPGLVGHARWARRLTKWLPGYEYPIEQALQVDGAPESIKNKRQKAWRHLSAELMESHPKSIQWTQEMHPHLSDLQLINRYRVPFQFRALVQDLPISSVWVRSEGNRVFDLDDQPYWDVTGSYGVNLLGTDFYKKCIQQAQQVAAPLGPVLGSYHPIAKENIEMLRAVSGMDEVTFHMSGTEAVMQAVRLARYQTGRRKLVRFAGAYHGWWDDVQPGPGNPMPPSEDTLTLREMHAPTLELLARRKDIACVLVNPIQALHPNQSAPGDSTLVTNGRRPRFDRQAYTRWLRDLREVCRQNGIAFILDEVFLGFRLGHQGAQAFYGVEADMVTYGKTLGGGLPVGVICGKKEWMRRYRPQRPADLCFARGTFNAHPYVMASMNEFLKHWMTPACKDMVEAQNDLWMRRLRHINQRLLMADMPVHFEGLQSVWTLVYERPSRYNWMLQYYLRRHGVALSWVGTGRFIFNFSYTDEDFDAVCDSVLMACQEMSENGWWWVNPDAKPGHIQLQILKEMWQSWHRKDSVLANM